MIESLALLLALAVSLAVGVLLLLDVLTWRRRRAAALAELHESRRTADVAVDRFLSDGFAEIRAAPAPEFDVDEFLARVEREYPHGRGDGIGSS